MSARLKTEILGELERAQQWDMSEFEQKQNQLLQTPSFIAILHEIERETNQMLSHTRIEPKNETAVQDVYCVVLRKLIHELEGRLRQQVPNIALFYIHDEKIENLFLDFNQLNPPTGLKEEDNGQDTLTRPNAEEILEPVTSRDLEKEYLLYLRGWLYGLLVYYIILACQFRKTLIQKYEGKKSVLILSSDTVYIENFIFFCHRFTHM